MNRLVKNGTHWLLDGYIQSQYQKKMWKEGKNNLIGLQQKLLKEGKHPQQRQHICPHCKKVGKGSIMSRWHFDKCKKRGYFQ